MYLKISYDLCSDAIVFFMIKKRLKFISSSSFFWSVLPRGGKSSSESFGEVGVANEGFLICVLLIMKFESGWDFPAGLIKHDYGIIC